MDVATGYSGRWHDYHMFKVSTSFEALQEGGLGERLRDAAIQINMPTGETVRLPLQLAADSAYACTQYLPPAFGILTRVNGPYAAPTCSMRAPATQWSAPLAF